MKRLILSLLLLASLSGRAQLCPTTLTEFNSAVDSIVALKPFRLAYHDSLWDAWSCFYNTYGAGTAIVPGDTAAMLQSYLQRGDTAAMLQYFIERSDTAAMLAPYISRGDTAAAFAPFIERSDTASMLNSYARYAEFLDSVAALRADVGAGGGGDGYVTDAEFAVVYATSGSQADTIGKTVAFSSSSTNVNPGNIWIFTNTSYTSAYSADFTGAITKVVVRTSPAGSFGLSVWSKSGNTLTLVSEDTLTASTVGTNTIVTNIPIQQGQFIGYRGFGTTEVTYNGPIVNTETEYLYFATFASSLDVTTGTPGNNVYWDFRAEITAQSDTTGVIGTLLDDVNALQANVSAISGQDSSIARWYGNKTPDAETSNASTSSTFFPNIPIKNKGYISALKVHSGGVATFKLKVARPNSEGGFDIKSSNSYTLASGSNTFDSLNIKVLPGDLVGYYASATSYTFTGNIGTPYFSVSGDASGTANILDQAAARAAFSVGFLVQEQPGVDKPKEFQVNQKFDTDTIPAYFQTDSFAFNGSYAISQGTGGDAALSSTYYSNISKRTMRAVVEVTNTTDKIILFTEPERNYGSVVEFDADSIRIYDNYNGGGTLPTTVHARAAHGLTIATGKKYELYLIKNYQTIHAVIVDELSGEADTLTAIADGTSTPSYGLGYGYFSITPSAGIIRVYEMQEWTHDIKDPKVIFYGNSITEGSGVTGIEGHWTKYAIDNAEGNAVLVSPEGGADARDVYARMAQELLFYSPEYVVVMIGTNDSDTTEWKEQIQWVHDLAGNYGIKILHCTLAPEDADANPEDVYNPFLRARGWRLVQMDKALSTNNDGVTRNSSVFADALHPNAAGYALMWDRLKHDAGYLFYDNKDNPTLVSVSASRNLGRGDVGKNLQTSSAITLGVPLNFGAMEVGETITVLNTATSSNTVTIDGATGVTVNGSSGGTATVTETKAGVLLKTGQNTYIFF